MSAWRWASTLVATVPVVWLLFYGWECGDGVLGEVAAFGRWGVAIAITFFLIVVLYCRDLHTVLALLPAEARVATPRSVWWMLVLPINFVEDFWIVVAVARSLERAGLGRFAARSSGLGWCAAQIVSLFPVVGQVASLVALPLWVHHWWSMRRAIRELRGPAPRSGRATATASRGIRVG